MATTTRSTGSPLRRPLVWSQNTSYTGAAGVHSEVSRKAKAIQVTGQRQLHSNLSTIHSIHKKELRSLNHHRKSLETSMLAYTQKMRRISSERLLLAASSNAAGPALSSDIGQGFRTLERLLVLSKSGQSTSCSPEADIGTTSADSEVDLPKTGGKDNERKIPHSRSLLAVGDSSGDSPHKPRPASFHAFDSSDDAEQKRNASRGPSSSQQRRPGTTEKPDVFALGLGTQESTAGSGEFKEDANKDTTSSDESSDASVAITPFPEYKVAASEVRVDEVAGVLFTTDEDMDRFQGASSPQFPRKKSTKTKENYWSFRKSQPRLSVSTASSNAFSKNQPQPETSFSQRQITPRPSRRQLQPKVKPPPPKKTYHHTFRYSDAVYDVIKSVDESETDKVFEKAVRRASEILPMLDIQDLRLERKRVREEAHKILEEFEQSKTSSPDTQRSDDGGNDADDGDGFFESVSRERSLSAPDILGHGDGRSSSKEVEGNELGIKSLLKKIDSAYLDNVPPRKTVQFRLPSPESPPEPGDE